MADLSFAQTRIPQSAAPVDLEKLESARDLNDRISQLVQADNLRQGDYLIGSGDLLNVEVFDVAELSRDVRVNDSGFISIPLIPVKIQAAGLTTFQLQDKVGELLQVNGLVSNPLVTIFVKEQHGQPITVIGAVKLPQVIQAVHQMTVLEAISQAGGIAEDAGSTILVTRNPRSVPQSAAAEAKPEPTSITIDLNDLLDSGDAKYNIPLVGGDVVAVPRAGIVYAVGAVQRSGGFVMPNDRQQMTVLKILSLTGGLAPSAKPRDAIILRQSAGGGERRQVPVDLSKVLGLKTEDVALLKGDILYVPDSTGKRVWRKAGEVALTLATGAALVRAAK
jgi:polysaccharide export outer membrane protein